MAKLNLKLAALLALAAFAASAARPVARWDVVPDQAFAGRFQPGVCAFHAEGVTVEFRIGGKLVHTADHPTLNRQSGVWEFWCPLDAAVFPDGLVTLEARAVPLAAGQASYDLPPLNLYANARGTLTVAQTNWVDSASGDDAGFGTAAAPFRTLAKAVRSTPPGGAINLKPGSYASDALGGGSERLFWTTIQAAPGAARDAVEVGPGRPGTQRLRWRGVTLFCDVEGTYTSILSGENGKHAVWLDGCKAYNKKGRWAANTQTFGNRYVAYVTGGVTTELHNGPAAVLIRDHALEVITSDAWTGGNKLVVNSSCRDIDPGSTGAHPDFHQSHAAAPGWCEDVILYNVRGTECLCQGLFGVRLRNAAFVNVLFEKGDTVMFSQYSEEMENALFLHVTIANQAWLWRNGFSPADVWVVNSLFPSMRQLDAGEKPGLRVESCHFADAQKTMGIQATVGDPLFRSPEKHDYRLQPTSPARSAARALQCVPADIDGVLHPATNRGRGCYADGPARQ
jgi:hypothetical protein